MHSIPPIESITLYRQDVVVNRKPGHAPGERPTRGEITEFSDTARKRLAFVACNTDVVFKTMVTLTYPQVYPTDGKTVKRHLKAFLEALKRYNQRSYSYLWFLEFQKRGAPHIHLLLDVVLPRRKQELGNYRHWVAQTWYRIVDSGDYKHALAGTRTERIRKPDGAKRYATKYAFKMQQKQVPAEMRNIGRFYGYSRDVVPQPRQTIAVTDEQVRAFLSEWPYKPNDDRPVYKVLYNVSNYFATGERPKRPAPRMPAPGRAHTGRVPIPDGNTSTSGKEKDNRVYASVDTGAMSGLRVSHSLLSSQYSALGQQPTDT